MKRIILKKESKYDLNKGLFIFNYFIYLFIYLFLHVYVCVCKSPYTLTNITYINGKSLLKLLIGMLKFYRQYTNYVDYKTK